MANVNIYFRRLFCGNQRNSGASHFGEVYVAAFGFKGSRWIRDSLKRVHFTRQLGNRAQISLLQSHVMKL